MIRKANKEDCLNLTALSIQVWLHSYARSGIRNKISRYALSTFTEQHFNKLLDDSKYRTLVFTEENHLIGYIIVNLKSYYQDKSNGYEIDTLYVQEHFHGKGIGRKLLLEIKKRFGQKFWLSTWIKNENAIGFYKHIGFKDIGQKFFKLEDELHENRVLAFGLP